MLPRPTTHDNLELSRQTTPERPFNPRRAPATEHALAIVANLTSEIEEFEISSGIRSRRRRSHDQTVFLNATQAVACDVIECALTPDASAIYVSRSHQDLAIHSRYRHRASTRQLPKILDTMSSQSLSVIQQTIGGAFENGERRRTVISIGSQLADLTSRSGLAPSDFMVVPGGETIILKRPRSGHWDGGGRMDYVDTDVTQQFRGEMDGINGHLQRADLSVIGDPHRHIDLSDRQLNRIFTQGRFDRGGRLFGGYWQPMDKFERRRHLAIDGEPIVEVDYGQIMPRLVYGLLEVTPTMADLYDIPGLDGCRPGIKKVMSSMLFVDRRLEKMPKGTRDLFPKKITIEQVVRAIEAAHPAIKPAFFTGIGHRCQYMESQILVSVLRRLNHLGITALPIHDAVLVPASASAIAQAVMLEVFRGQTGAHGVVDVVGRSTPSCNA